MQQSSWRTLYNIYNKSNLFRLNLNIPNISKLTNSNKLNDANKNSLANDAPQIPEEIACCGSGCQNCVWLSHAEKILEFYDKNFSGSNEAIKKALSEIEKLNDENLKAFLRMELKMKLK